MIKIVWLKPPHATVKTLMELNVLMRQLNPDRKKGTLYELKRMIASSTVAMCAAKDDGRVVGIATLYLIQKMGRILAHVDDVVVDEKYRGRGIGEKLLRSLIQEARKRRVASIYVTSGDARPAANRLYRKVGFTARPTNPFHIPLQTNSETV
jgi:ribosomal protein S18 acetylase RimI-like enzyme